MGFYTLNTPHQTHVCVPTGAHQSLGSASIIARDIGPKSKVRNMEISLVYQVLRHFRFP